MNVAVKPLLLAALLSLPLPAGAQVGHGHDKKTSCCNLAECGPTETGVTANHYEGEEDGRQVRVPVDKTVKVAAPDGPNVCVPPLDSEVWRPDDVFCTQDGILCATST